MDTPFIYDRYVTDRNFIGRKTDCNTLSNLLSAKENVTIYEPPKSGKMSIIQQAFFSMRMSNVQFLAAEVNAFNIREKNRFLTAFGSAVIRASASTPQEYGDIMSKHLQGTHFVFDRQLFAATEEIVSLNWDADTNDMLEMFRLPGRIAADSRSNFHVIVEEFQNLTMIPDYEEIFKALETVLSERDTEAEFCASFILTGSMVNAMKKIFEEQKHFYRMTEHLPLHQIDDKDIVEHIVRGFRTSGKVIEMDLAAKAIGIFRANIWYLNHFISICDSLSKGYMNEGVLMEALRIILSIHEPRFFSTMNNLTDHQISLLKAILDGEIRFSASEVIEKYRLNSSANVRRVKDALMKKEIITFNDRDEPVILDPLFQHWLEYHYFGIKKLK